MFGNLLSGVVKVATCPIDIAEAAADVVIGDGDGSKRSRQRNGVSFPSDVRDAIAKALEDLDD